MTIWNQNELITQLQYIFGNFSFTPLIKNNVRIYFIFICFILLINYANAIIMLIMAIRIKNKKLNILWTISFLKFTIPFMSFTFFGQCFLSLSTIFTCQEGHSYISSNLKCRSGIWFYLFGSFTGVGLILQSIIALITSSLYFKPIFINSGSDLLKKTNSFPDTIFIITRIAINLLFILDKGLESEHWAILFFLILFTGTNAYYNLYYQNKANKTINLLNNIFCLVIVSAYVALFIGKVFKELEFSGSIYLFFISVIIIILYIFFYKNKEIDYIIIDYKEINNPDDYLYYISVFYKIIKNKKNSRNNLTVLESLISEIEENCIITDCPLKKYLENIKNGIECPFLLNQYCEKLFEYGISKFPDDVSLKNNYSIFLVVDLNYQKKALMILKSIKKKSLSFQNNYDVYRTLRLIEKWNFSVFKKNNSTFEYRKNIQEFKSLIKKLTLLYYDFISLLLGSKLQNIDNFNKINKIGREIMKYSPKIEESYNNLMNVKTDNLEIIKLYSEFVEGVLKDEEKLEKCQNMSKLTYSSEIEIHEKDFSNFDIEILNEKVNLPYIIISANKEQLGKIIDFSLNVSKIFGYLKSELLGQHINILIPKLFQKNHDLIIKEEYEKNRLKLFDNLNKRKVYVPDFMKKDVFGVSKMKFLIELKINIYFVKTEENKLIYIIEIMNYNPIMLDLIKNENNDIKYCVLTDENFLIQTFTPNCLEDLKLSSDYIHSNFSIINYIKQFQDDYLNAINNTNISKHSHINKTEINVDDNQLDQKSLKGSIPPIIKKKIKNDLFLSKYSKKCIITWRINDDINSNNSKIETNNTTNNYLDLNYEPNKSSFFKTKKSDEAKDDKMELDLCMDIRRVIIKDELLGYFFYFNKTNKNKCNNIHYTLQKNDVNNNKTNLIQIKKFQCEFRSPDSINEKEGNNSKTLKGYNMFSSLIVRSSKTDFKNLRKKEKKKSLDKYPKVSFKEKGNQIVKVNPLIAAKNNILEFRENDNLITGDYVPKFTSYFSLDLKNLSFIKINETDEQPNYLDILKKEAEEKKKVYDEKLKLLSKDSETSSNESDEFESEEDTSENISIINTPKANFNQKDISDNKKEEKEEEKDIIKEDDEKIQKKKTKKEFEHNHDKSNSTTSLNNIKGINSSKKMIIKNNLYGNYYKVNLDNIYYMVYDFYKDMIIDGKKSEITSKMETIINNSKNQDSIDLLKDERFSFISLFHQKTKSKKSNKNVTNKGNDLNNNIKTSTEDNKIILNEEKLFEKKVSEALKKQKDEPPIKRLKIFTNSSYIIIIIIGIIIAYINMNYFSLINQTLYIIKNIIFVKYCSHISVFYLRELSLLNFFAEGIKGGEYTGYPAQEKEEYIDLIKDEIMKLFIENQESLKIIYSNSLVLSNASATFLTKTKLKIKMSKSPKVDISNIILISLMQYNGAFNNLATSTGSITQNHPDLFNFIYNNLNGYKTAINNLLNIYRIELEKYLKILIRLVIISSILVFLCFVGIYIIILFNFFAAIERRGNYMKVFYGINENILKMLIFNCENLINKLKTSEEQRFHEDETVNESIEEKITLENNQKISQRQKTVSQSFNLNYGIDNIKSNRASSSGIVFIILYGIFILISFSFFIYNGIYIIKFSKESITISFIFNKVQSFQLGIIDTFNVYREYLFDNQSIINGTLPFNYLAKAENESLMHIIEDIQYLNTNYDKIFLKNKNFTIKDNLCSYYINDYFDSSVDCSDKIGLITGYDFFTLSYYFLEEIKIDKKIVSYKLKNENILGNLTDYNVEEYLNDDRIPKEYDETDYKTIFRLDLFNNYTIHTRLNVIFFSIILPYIQDIRRNIFDSLSLENSDKFLIIISISFAGLVTVVFFCYFIPMINFINNIIYKTKNMLSIIPLSILSSQSGVSSLLNLSKDK